MQGSHPAVDGFDRFDRFDGFGRFEYGLWTGGSSRAASPSGSKRDSRPNLR